MIKMSKLLGTTVLVVGAALVFSLIGCGGGGGGDTTKPPVNTPGGGATDVEIIALTLYFPSPGSSLYSINVLFGFTNVTMGSSTEVIASNFKLYIGNDEYPVHSGGGSYGVPYSVTHYCDNNTSHNSSCNETHSLVVGGTYDVKVEYTTPADGKGLFYFSDDGKERFYLPSFTAIGSVEAK